MNIKEARVRVNDAAMYPDEYNSLTHALAATSQDMRMRIDTLETCLNSILDKDCKSKENKMNGEELYTAYVTEWGKFNTWIGKWNEITEIDRHIWNLVATRLNTNATPPSEPYQDCPLHFVAYDGTFVPEEMEDL